MDKIKAIMLLDDDSKRMIKTNIADFTLHNIVFVNNLVEITEDMLTATNRVVVLEGFLRSSTGFSDLCLFKALEGLSYLYVGQDEQLIAQVKDIADCFKAELASLDFEALDAALYLDYSMEKANSEFHSDSVVFAKLVLQNIVESDRKLVTLANDYLANVSYTNYVLRELDSARSRCRDLELSSARLTKENDMLTKGYLDIMQQSVVLNDSLQEYEHVLTKDVYDKFQLHNYPSRPQIVYLKEYEEILHLYSFINTLFEVFRVQGKQSVKVLQLLDSVNSRRAKVLPEYYTLIENGYLLKDVIINDYLCKIGDYKGVLEALLQNRNHLDVLIIVDCKCYNDTVLSGSFLQFNLCRNYQHLLAYGLIPDNTIVSNCTEPGFLAWNHLSEYYNFEDNNERFLFLSSQPVIQRIVTLQDIFQRSV